MNRCKNHSKLIIFLVLSLCLFMRCIQGEEITFNDSCDADYPYYQTYHIFSCINETGCQQTEEYTDIYLTPDQFFCSETDQYCKPTYNNKPGYYKLEKGLTDQYTVCNRCQQNKPISNNNVCEQCPDQKIFPYVALSGQTEPCVTIDEIKLTKDTSGIFDVDLKIYYQSDYICPQGQLKKSLIFETDDGELTFQKCDWCPISTPKTQDGKCVACTGGQIPDEETHSCIDADKCKNILSKDGKMCYQSTCPLGQFIDSSIPQSKKCNTCSGNKFPSVDQKSCVSSCGANEALHEATSSCIPSESCDGFYSDIDTNKTKCLKDSCQRIEATLQLPASIVQGKADGKSYQVCSTCPQAKSFVKFEDRLPTNECKNCPVDYKETISDYVTGVCIYLVNIQYQGILNEDQTIYYPNDMYECKKGYFLTLKSNNIIQYQFCQKCPSHFPISDGNTCTNNCPDGEIADYTSASCVTSQNFNCDVRLSTDSKLCSPVCKPGEKMADDHGCEKCSEGSPYSSADFRTCKSIDQCFYDFENQTCLNSASDCQQKGKNYYYQNGSKVCKQNCQPNEIITLKDDQPSCITKCNKYSYFYGGYQYCQDSCKEDEYVDLETKVCYKFDRCFKYITGTPRQCLDACLEGEVLMQETGNPYKECVIANQCKTALVEQPDKSFFCTKNCFNFVNNEDKKCVNACPTDFYQNNEQTNSNYYICYKTCPAGKLNFTSPTDGKKQCIYQNDCRQYISSDKTSCTADCLKDEIAFQNGDITTCEEDGFDCGSKLYQYKYKNYRICNQYCNHFMSENSCFEKCPDDAKYALEKGPSDTFQKCTSECENYFFLNNYGNLQCSQSCNSYLDVDNKQCLKACNSSHYILEQKENENFQRCSVDCSKIKYIDSRGLKQCVSVCDKYLQTDTSECVDSCQLSEFIYDKVDSETYTKCSSTCDDIEYTDEIGLKRCIKKCSDYLSPDKKVCQKSCGVDEFINERVEGDSHIQCSDTCSNFKSTEGGKKYCKNKCLLFVSSQDTHLCQSSCLSDFVMEQKPGADYTECSSTCDDIEYTDDKGAKRCVKDCSDYLSANKKVCKKSCGEDEFINEKLEGENYIQCSNTCPESTYQQVDEKGLRQCVKECMSYVSSDKKACIKSCPSEEFTNDKKDKTYYECSQKCELLYSYTDEKGIKRCTDTCPFYLGTNQKDCNQSCQGSEYAKDKENGEIFFRCSATCDDFEYDIGDNIKRCGKACPNNQIIYQKENKCLKSKKDCTYFISSKGNECTSDCITTNIEYPKNMNGFKQCTPCQGYYKANDQTCSQACGTDEIGFPASHECFNKEEGEKKCKDISFKLSVDKTKCTQTCQYPEITTFVGECISPCDPKNVDCSNCKTGEYLFQNGSEQSCKISCGDMFISSDNKRCLIDCSYIRELAPESGKSCLKCKDKEVLVLQSENKYICKSIEDPQIFTDKLNTAKAFVAQEMKSKDQIEEVKNQVAEIAQDTFKQLSESKDKSPKELLNEFINLTKSMVQNIKITEFANLPYKIGSKDTILVQTQNIATGFRYKKVLDIDQIQDNSEYSLTEENLDEQQETITLLATSVIASNPACKTDACKIYPVFQLDKTQNTARRILQASQDFTITFNLKDSTDIKKYTCLSYDLSNPTADPTIIQTTIVNDNKSISCLVSGSVSILLDSTCQYIDKSLCPKTEDSNSNNNYIESGDDDEDELSGGEIAGIVIGVIAFLAISAFIVFKIIKRKQSNTFQKVSADEVFTNRQQLQTEEPINTLGIHASEKQV